MTPEDTQQLADLLRGIPGAKGIDIKDVRRVAQLLRDSPEIGSIELKGLFGTGVTITRTAAVPFASALPLPPMVPGAPAPTAPGPVSAESAPAPSPLKEIRSPMVGTFYSAPEPGADSYVRIGHRVAPGQTVCIIEAMKIMNEIEAEIGGVVREICVENAQPVEFGQVLYRVDPHG
jgi:acetyl-CoA carboxylase biotin carboxyl carrier protein